MHGSISAVFGLSSANERQILYVLQFWYIIAVALIKMSVLYLYARIFRTSGMPLGIKIMMALVLGWMVSFLFATFFQVWPIRCNWIVCDPTTNYPAMYVLSSVTDVILDIAILSLPISFVRKLKMSKSKKIGVTAIFGLGILYVPFHSDKTILIRLPAVPLRRLHGLFIQWASYRSILLGTMQSILTVRKMAPTSVDLH